MTESVTRARIPYGAVYFRKSNPPRADWERDYRVASEDGINIFRHWFSWSAIEVAPGVYDWDDFDRQLELAEKYRIGTIIAEMVTAAPEWLYAQRPEARLVHADGRQFPSGLSGSCSTGGFHAMSLDDEVVRVGAERFLTELVTRYRSAPALVGYDVWNECNYVADSGYGPATARRFRTWLQSRYPDLQQLAQSWGRHSLTDWDQVVPPVRLEAYTESLDWLEFQQDNALDLLRWRVDLIRALDPDHPITAHGIAASLVSSATNGADDWRSAKEVDIYGCTWVESRQGDADWQHLHAIDLTRAASRGKDFWHAEAQGGPLWLQPQVVDRPLDDGRVTRPEDLRLWNMTSFCGGARGLLFPRWRPLLNGPLFGAFGPYGMDGARTENSAMASAVARWTNSEETEDLFASGPIRGEVGIVYAAESQLWEHLLVGNASSYTAAARGAYRGFFDANIQADFVHIDDIADYQLIYLPYPIMLTAAHARALAGWVRSGGSLVIEGCPGYFGDQGWVGQTQPNHGLDELLGAVQDEVIFAPDLYQDLTIELAEDAVPVGVFRQSYRATTGDPVGYYPDGGTAVVDANAGDGRTRVLGSFPSIGYHRSPSEGGKRYFSGLLAWAGIEQHVQVSGDRLTARIFDGAGGRFLWVLNHARSEAQGTIELGQHQPGVDTVTALWGAGPTDVRESHSVAVTVGPRDALVLRLNAAV